MANVWYSAGVDKIMTGGCDLTTATIKAVLVDSPTYTFSASHANLSDIPSGARKGTVTLTSKTVSGKIFDAADVTFTAVTAGGPYEYIIIYKDTGVESTSTLLLFIDTASGLPITANNNDVQVQWAALGIAQLG